MPAHMFVSVNCLDLIEEFEGMILNAYRDPVGIPTIGYGTIRYPDGRKVQMGDEIAQRDAEAFLKFECDAVAKEVSALVRVPLNQNQFDALVAFSYNVGTGAFRGSTLLRELNQGRFATAAAEFLRWDKGTIDGIKQPLKGLARRRRRERALFLATTNQGEPITVDESPQDRVTRLEGFRDPSGKNIVVARDEDNAVVEIVEIADATKDHLITVIGQYPNAGTFDMVSAPTAMPAGPIIQFSLRGSGISKEANPPILPAGVILIRGAGGPDDPSLSAVVKDMQARLKDLGYFTGEIDGDFGGKTDEAAKRFQARFFGTAQADGKVGPKTWSLLWGTQPAPLQGSAIPTVAARPASPGDQWLELTKSMGRDQFKCTVLHLRYFKDGKLEDQLEVCSGAPGRQSFRTAQDSISGSHEPLPEGHWRVHDIEWADGPGNYGGKIWNRGLGPAKIRMDYLNPGSTRRSAIEIHIDWNRHRGSAGTAGCIGIYSIADYKRLVTWLTPRGGLRNLFVNWGLGTCPPPHA